MNDFAESRRRFLKSAGLAAGALLLSPKSDLARVESASQDAAPASTPADSGDANYMGFGFMTLFDYV